VRHEGRPVDQHADPSQHGRAQAHRPAGDPDRAGVRTYMCELRQDHAGTPSRAYGLYQDDVVRTADGWRFARRRYQSIGRGEQGLDLMPPPEIF